MSTDSLSAMDRIAAARQKLFAAPAPAGVVDDEPEETPDMAGFFGAGCIQVPPVLSPQLIEAAVEGPDSVEGLLKGIKSGAVSLSDGPDNSLKTEFPEYIAECLDDSSDISDVLDRFEKHLTDCFGYTAPPRLFVTKYFPELTYPIFGTPVIETFMAAMREVFE